MVHQKKLGNEDDICIGAWPYSHFLTPESFESDDISPDEKNQASKHDRNSEYFKSRDKSAVRTTNKGKDSVRTGQAVNQYFQHFYIHYDKTHINKQV